MSGATTPNQKSAKRSFSSFHTNVSDAFPAFRLAARGAIQKPRGAITDLTVPIADFAFLARATALRRRLNVSGAK